MVHGFKQQYPRMSLEWILDKPLALCLGPPPSSLECLLSLSLAVTHTYMQRLQRHYRHSANLIKRDFVMRISPTASWPEWQQCGWVEKQEEDRRTIGGSSGHCVCVCVCAGQQASVCIFVCVCVSAQACACVHTAMCWPAKMFVCKDVAQLRRDDGGVTHEEPAASWWRRLAVSAGAGAGYGSTINRPHDGKTSGQRPWETSLTHRAFGGTQ